MVNYYEILGLKNDATSFEIKTAFRQLAKLYHPDKNPEGNDHFSKVLKAYETLINPELKLSYDYKLHYSRTQSTTSPRPKKKQSFEEQQKKRDNYYDEHIKKYEKKRTQTVQEPQINEHYNEFKYILFATPLAVVLFLLIVNLARQDRAIEPSLSKTEQKLTSLSEEINNDLKLDLTDSALINVLRSFGENKYVFDSDVKIEVKNKCDTPVLICLFNKQMEFIRMQIIDPYSGIILDKLPNEKILIRYHIPSRSSSSKSNEKDLFFKSIELLLPETINPLTLHPNSNKGFIRISRKEFFEHSKNTYD